MYSPRSVRQSGTYVREYGYRGRDQLISYIPSEDVQGVFSCISIFDDNIYNIQMINNEAQGAIRIFHSGVLPKRESREDGWYQGRIMRDLIEHGAVGAVVHGVEDDFEVDGLRHGRLSNYLYWHKGGVIHVVVCINKSEIG